MTPKKGMKKDVEDLMSSVVPSQDERLIARLGMYTPEMLDSLNESRERDRLKNLVIQITRREPWLSQFLLGMNLHTGLNALTYTQTACVWVDPVNLRFNLAVNPFFMQSMQIVDVERGKLPLDASLQRKLEGDNYKVSIFEDPPEFIKQSMQEAGHSPRKPDEWIAVRVDLNQQIAILKHELLHILHQHIQQFHDRGLYPDAQVLNLAMDVAINQFIEHLPPEAVTLESYANDPDHPLKMPLKESFDTYYEILTDFYKGAKRGKTPPKTTKTAVQGFPAGTLVHVQGGTIPIERLTRKSRVLTFDQNGSLVERFVIRVKKEEAAVTDSQERLATNFFKIKTSNHLIDRLSGKVKVWVDGIGWKGVGEDTLGPGGTSIPPVSIGDMVRTLQGTTMTTEPVTQTGTLRRVPDEVLYQLAVQTVGNPSSFIVNGIVVKGIDILPSGSGGTEGPPPDGPVGGDDDQMSEPPDQSEEGNGKGQDSDEETSKGKDGEPPDKPKKPKKKPGEQEEGKGPKKKEKEIKGPVDDHSTWNKIPGRLQREAMRRWTQNAQNRMKQKGMYGTAPGYIRTIIENILQEPTVDWRSELRSWVGSKQRKGYRRTRKRPSRRHGWLLPGQKVLRGSNIWVAVDNSGSVTPQEARQFAAEFIDILKGGHTGILIVWDTEIRQVRPIRNTSDLEDAFKDLGGGGGSTGVPKVFAALEHPELLHGEVETYLRDRPDGIIVFTDGDIQWPARGANLGIPTLWGITRENNVSRVPFGEGLYIDLEGID